MMNRKIGVVAAWVNMAAVAGFAVSMLAGSLSASYLTSMLIAFSFLPLMSAFAHLAQPERRVAGQVALAFSAVYVTLILLVYFTQMTAVRLDPLSESALAILSYQRFGLFFSLDLLGYGLMALATFFAGLSFQAQGKAECWLKALLLIHGVFFPACLAMPMLGVFSGSAGGAEWIGTAVLLFWCAYFLPVGWLSMMYIRKRG